MTSAKAGSEPVFVFGTNLAGHHESESARFAEMVHEAESGVGNGATGNAYAVPYQSSDGKLLDLEVISNYVDSLFKLAAANPDTRYQIARFACEDGAHGDEAMAQLFSRGPKNLLLPGVWKRLVQSGRPARLLLFDPGANFAHEPAQEALKKFLDLNAPLWDVPSVEVVSVGQARAIVANDKAAKKLGLVHRVIGMNNDLHGRDALLVAEAKAVWYATHLLCVFDFDQTGQPQQMRILNAAKRGGLLIDQIDTSMFR